MMTDEPESLVLAHLCWIGQDVAALRADMTEVKTRLSELTQIVVSQGRAQVGLYETNARLDVRVDRVEGRLERIERRLESVD